MIWQSIPPSLFSLQEEELHLYLGSLNLFSNSESSFFDLLDLQERKRAGRYYFSKDRSRFIRVRAFLKILLSKYLKSDPRDIFFLINRYGKPEIPSLQFNLSHSKNHFLIAITLSKRVGVDLEILSKERSFLKIAERYFSSSEFSALKNLSGQEQLQRFYQGWTYKEALIKAMGKGLFFPLKNISLPLKEIESFQFYPISLERKTYQVSSIPLPLKEYVAAVAVEGEIVKKINCYRLSQPAF